MLRVPKVNLGSTRLKVSKLGFGTYDFGVPSLHVSPEEGGQILIEAHGLGVNFWDTSDDYASHPHVASALKSVPRREAVISTKTYARTGGEAEKSMENSLRELGTDYVDVFLLHFVQHDWVQACQKVLKHLATLKDTEIVGAIGLSTHSVAVVREAAGFEELDVIMALCCKASQKTIDKYHDYVPLEDGSMREMVTALKMAHEKGKGVIAIKVLGNAAQPFIKNHQSYIRSVAKLNFVDSMVIGMKNLEQVKKNIKALIIG